VRHRQLKLTDYGPAPGLIDAAVEWLLVALLAFLPFAFGAVEPWSEFVAVAAALVLSVLLVVRRLTRRDCPGAWSWAYVPVALYVLLVLLQLAQLSPSLVGAETVALKSRLLADLPEATRAAHAATLSFYPPATRHDLRVVLLAAAVFAAVVEVYRRPEQVRRLLVAVTCIGGAVALLALAQHVTGATHVYWTVPLRSGARAEGGPFVNHNHFAQFMNLSIGAALGLLVVKLRELNLRGSWGAGDVMAALREPEFRAAWLYGAVVVGGAVAIFLSMSRGGMIGMLVALAFTVAGLARRQHLRQQGWVLLALAFAAFAGVLYTGFDAVYDRLAQIGNYPDATGGRFQIVRDVARVWQKFPVLGTGLGTHAYVFPAYDRTGEALLAAHVENEYVQAAEETGALGLLLVLAFVGIIWANFVRAARAGRPRIAAAAFGLGYGLLAVMVHSISDFGQHIPAVAALSAVTCGVLVVLARMARQAEAAQAALDAAAPAEGEEAPPPVIVPERRRPLRLAVPVAAAVLLGWAALGANQARDAAAYSRAAERVAATLEDNNWDGSDEDFTELLRNAAECAETERDNVEYRYWLNVYRWRAIGREHDAETGETLLTAEALDFARQIVSELHAARPLCPTYGPVVSLAGQLEAFVLDDPAGLGRIRTAYELSPGHPDVVFSAALADAAAGDFDASLAKFRRCVEMSPATLAEVMNVYENQFDRPDLAIAAAEQSRQSTPLLVLAARLRARGDAGGAALAVTARAAGTRILAERVRQPGAPPWAMVDLAGLYVQDKRNEEAITLYRDALAADYGQVDWRLALARVLAASGRHAEALREAQICLRLRPGYAAAEQLVGQLSVPRGAPATAPAELSAN
jgi:O-antigen ligase